MLRTEHWHAASRVRIRFKKSVYSPYGIKDLNQPMYLCSLPTLHIYHRILIALDQRILCMTLGILIHAAGSWLQNPHAVRSVFYQAPTVIKKLISLCGSWKFFTNSQIHKVSDVSIGLSFIVPIANCTLVYKIWYLWYRLAWAVTNA